MMKKNLLVVLACAALPNLGASASILWHFVDFNEDVQEATNAGRLDGSVKFYLGNTPRGASIMRKGVTTSKKTNAFGKSDEAACSWMLQSALIHLQNSAKAAGANAVVNLASNYKNKEYKSTKDVRSAMLAQLWLVLR